MIFYPFHIADFALHTSHLTFEEEAVYRKLLDFYYDTEKPIPIETQPVVRRLRLGSHEETVGLVLEEFFVKEADGWHNLRVDFEIKEYLAKAETARKNGKKGGRPKKNSGLETQPVPVANPDLTQPKATITNTITNTTTKDKDIVPAKAGKRKTSWPADFILNNHRANLAINYWVKKQRTDLDVREIFEQFNTHAMANGVTKMDWNAAWQTWYVNAVKFEKKTTSNQEPTHDEVRAAIAKRMDRSWAE